MACGPINLRFCTSPPSMSTRSSKESTLASCPCSSRQGSSWRSTQRPRRRSVRRQRAGELRRWHAQVVCPDDRHRRLVNKSTRHAVPRSAEGETHRSWIVARCSCAADCHCGTHRRAAHHGASERNAHAVDGESHVRRPGSQDGLPGQFDGNNASVFPLAGGRASADSLARARTCCAHVFLDDSRQGRVDEAVN
jgi:hypothetical protein